MKQRHLIFHFEKQDYFELFNRFYPKGQTVVNSSEWMGKEPRSCGVVNLQGGGTGCTVVVAYRPKGFITFVGNTRYDGWTAMLESKNKEGILLDEEGQPLKAGQKPVFKPVEVFEEVDFNTLDFGKFVQEVELQSPPVLNSEQVMKDMHDAMMKGGSMSMSMNSDFIAMKRIRPATKVILTNHPAFEGSGGFGERIINIDVKNPQLARVIQDTIERTVIDFLEGRASIPTFSVGDMVFVDLTKVLVDCTPNEQNKESRFSVLMEYISIEFLEELAQRLMANYLIEANAVTGDKAGLLLRHDKRKRRDG